MCLTLRSATNNYAQIGLSDYHSNGAQKNRLESLEGRGGRNLGENNLHETLFAFLGFSCASFSGRFNYSN